MTKSEPMSVRVANVELTDAQVLRIMQQFSLLLLRQVPSFILKYKPEYFGKPLVVFGDISLTTRLRAMFSARSERVLISNYLFFVISPHLEIPIILDYLKKAYPDLRIDDSEYNDTLVPVQVQLQKFLLRGQKNGR